jgi:hypothetical protein
MSLWVQILRLTSKLILDNGNIGIRVMMSATDWHSWPFIDVGQMSASRGHWPQVDVMQPQLCQLQVGCILTSSWHQLVKHFQLMSTCRMYPDVKLHITWFTGTVRHGTDSQLGKKQPTTQHWTATWMAWWICEKLHAICHIHCFK